MNLNPDNVDAFMHAAEYGNVGELTRLHTCADGVPVDASKSTKSPLLSASENGCVNAVRLLLSWGANVNWTTDAGYTPLMCACIHGHQLVAEMLLKSGAHINLTNMHGYTALHHACAGGFVSVASVLLRNGANYKITCEEGEVATAKCKDRAKRAQIQAIIDPLRAPPSPPTPAPAPAPIPASVATEQQLRAQLASVTNERDSAERQLIQTATQLADRTREKDSLNTQLSQRDSVVAEKTRTIDQLRTQLSDRTRERDAAVEQAGDRVRERDVAVAQLASRTRERDAARHERGAAICERDQLRLTAAAGESTSAPVVIICPFQRYRSHLLVPDIVHPAVGPGTHSVPDASPLFTYCKALTKSGGQRFCPVAGHRLVHVQAIINDDETQAVYTGTQLRMKRLRTQGGAHFNFTTATGFGLDQLNVLSVLRDQFQERAPGETAANSINTVYCYHGPRREHLASVCSTGLVAVRGTDAGFFGSGCYTTLNMEYALRYSRGELDADGGPRPTPDGRYPVVMLAATVGMAYPVTPGADYGNEAGIRPGHSDYFGRPLEPGFDCHVICVNQQSGFQAVTKDQGEYVELVFDQQSQLLPIAVLWFEEN